MFKKLIALIFILGSFYYIQSLDPETNQSNINIQADIEYIKDLRIEKVYEYLNRNWFDIKLSKDDEGFDITIKDDSNIEGSEDEFVTISQTPGGSELQKIAAMITKNETNNNRDNLIHWNVGESFASMGIGHFIWYPKNRQKQFGEQFPAMIQYLIGIGVDVPNSIRKQITIGSFWNSKSEWEAARNTKLYNEVLNFLDTTKMQQAQYIQQRFIIDLLRLYSTSSRKDMMDMNKKIKQITLKPGGWYVLMDYANFKGIGGSPNKRYNDYDWGLKAVLLNMKRFNTRNVLHSFSKSATYTLQTRVKNAPKSSKKQEQKWMAGWQVRTNGYKDPY